MKEGGISAGKAGLLWDRLSMKNEEINTAGETKIGE